MVLSRMPRIFCVSRKTSCLLDVTGLGDTGFSLCYRYFFYGGLMKRRKMSRSGSRKLFTRMAVRKPRRNFQSNPMRGGIRL